MRQPCSMPESVYAAFRQRVRPRPDPPLRAREEGHAGGLTGAELRVGWAAWRRCGVAMVASRLAKIDSAQIRSEIGYINFE